MGNDHVGIQKLHLLGVVDMIYPRGDIRMLSYLPRQAVQNKNPLHAHCKPVEL